MPTPDKEPFRRVVQDMLTTRRQKNADEREQYVEPLERHGWVQDPRLPGVFRLSLQLNALMGVGYCLNMTGPSGTAASVECRYLNDKDDEPETIGSIMWYHGSVEEFIEEVHDMILVDLGLKEDNNPKP